MTVDAAKPAEVLRRAREIEAGLDPAAGRVAVLASFSAEFLRPYLTVESHRLGCPLRFWLAPFNLFEPLVEDPASDLWHPAPRLVWLALRLEDVDRRLPEEAPELGPEATAARLADLRRRLVGLAAAVRARTTAPVVVSNFAPPAVGLPDLFDAGNPDGFVHLLAAANRDLARDAAALADVHLFDYAGAVADTGAGGWVDRRLWYLGRVGCAPANQPRLARRLARTVAALLRPAAKCLVVDLDDTLWGGVLGDDGIAGLAVGDDFPGNVYKDFQAALLGLRRRGLLLAVATKNDEATVFEALDRHPDLVLRREHFAAIHAGWGPKPESLRAIAAELNLGLDSLVFLDDNPVERAAVRAELPEVTVVELPADPVGFLDALAAVAELDRPRLVAEDLARADLYRAEAARTELRSAAPSLGDFLAGLEMEAEVGRGDEATLPRIHQLIQKTNQFNLTTVRHDLATVRALADSPDAAVVWLRLRDRLSVLGLVCVGILRRREDGEWEIDTFLMSCRVMGRRVEDAFLAYLAELAAAAGARRLAGAYRPTAKNRLVRDFYPDHGFTAIGGAADSGAEPGERLYALDLGGGLPAWPDLIRRAEGGEG